MLEYTHSGRSLIITLPEESLVASSAVYGGGMGQRQCIVNHTIDHQQWKQRVDAVVYATNLCQMLNCPLGQTVILLTAVAQQFLQIVPFGQDKLRGVVFVTAGVANARAVGDPALDYPDVGTINTIVVVENALDESALLHILESAGGIKSQVFERFGIKSSLSGRSALATGTDVTVVGTTRQLVRRSFTGLQTAIGQLWMMALENALEKALSDAINANPFNKRFIIAA